MIAATIKPTKERRRHDVVERVAQQIVDSTGAAGDPWRTLGLLARLEGNGDISAAGRAAGDEFHRLFHLAAMDPLRAADMGRVHRGYGGVAVMPGSESAYRKVGDALDALGGLGAPNGDCAYFVLGLDESLRQFSARLQWRGADHMAAKGVLVGTLGVLVKHFGY